MSNSLVPYPWYLELPAFNFQCFHHFYFPTLGIFIVIKLSAPLSNLENTKGADIENTKGWNLVITKGRKYKKVVGL